LVEHLGCDISGFNHTSAGSLRNILLLFGETIQNEVLSDITGPFGILVDDMTDIENLQQMIGFIQHYSKSSEKVQVNFLCLENVLANSDKAESKTIISVLLKVIKKRCLNFEWFKSFVSDGASVMVGERSGLATRLKADRCTARFMEEKNITWWKTPPESPDLNPVELLWHELKHLIRTIVKPHTKEQLVDGISRFWNESVNADKCAKYIGHLQSVLPIVVARQGKAPGK